MKAVHYTDIDAKSIEVDGVSGVTMRMLISHDDGAPNFAMRLFHVEPGGYTFHHSHDWEHEMFVIEGQGEAITPDGTKPVQAGYAIFVPPGEVHQFRNTGATRLSFLCLVPLGAR
ncbi:MAG: cupin domain-containing protein [Candidatus Zhuqueibacterota bacterium]